MSLNGCPWWSSGAATHQDTFRCVWRQICSKRPNSPKQIRPRKAPSSGAASNLNLSILPLQYNLVPRHTLDLIFGNAAAVFQNCLILPRKPLRSQKNMITAQGRDDPNQNSGFSMQNCTIAPAPAGLTTEDSRTLRTFLGRTWRNYSRTVIMNSYIGKLVHPQGWYKWNKYSRLDTVEYVEYNNYGPGSDTKRRVKWRGFKRNCSVGEVREFGVGSFLRGDDDWLLTTGFPMT